MLSCDLGRPSLGTTSSDGLIYVRIVDGSSDIARVRLSDGAVQAVTATPDRAERWPYWSDAAGRVVYQVSHGNDVAKSSDLVLWDPETGTETPLITTPRREERWPSWSPDGRTLAYVFRGGRPRAGVVLLTPGPGTTVLLARENGRDFFLRPEFSPDGRLLVAQRRSGKDGGSRLWLLEAGRSPRALTRDERWIDTKAYFTRDGAAVVYTRRPAKAPDYDVALVPATGGRPRTLLGSDADEHSARPSPTRDELVLCVEEDGRSDVFLADLDGGGLRALRRTPDWNELAPKWSPDGERVVVTAVPADVAGFGSMNARALASTRLVVLDREGRTLLETPGAMADWLPPWR